MWLDYALEVLLYIVRQPNNKDFEIRWPTLNEIQSSLSLLHRNRLHGVLFRGVFGVINGGRMPCAV